MSDTSKDSSPANEAELAPLTETQRRMREALERKKSATGEHPGNAGSAGQKLKDSNSKRQRQFRRKSGG
jgi:hypothetical protein